MSPSTDQRENREFASEVKFRVTPSVAEQIRGWVRNRLASDPHSGESGDAYLISSLYFDTDRFDVFHRCGSFARAKYRVRRYNQGDIAFLERKLRTRGLLAKRRSIVGLDELGRLADRESRPDWEGHWFHRRLLARHITPVCEIRYRRHARVAMTANGPIRLTLDTHLRTLPADGPAFSTAPSGMKFLEDQVILELKFRREIPVLFKLLVEEFALSPQPTSKYRLATAALGYVRTDVSNPPATGPVSTPAVGTRKTAPCHYG